MRNDSYHLPVLLKEVVEVLKPEKGKKYIDATLGFGGHSGAIIDKGGQVLGIEWDPEVLKLVKERFAFFQKKAVCPGVPYQFLEGNFSEINKIARENNFYPVDGIIFDLGISRWHYQSAKRGFSFDDPTLDMRLSPSLSENALEIINSYSYEQLYRVFTEIAQEKLAEPIAKALVRSRRLGEIKSARQLSELISQIYEQYRIRGKTRPATKVFLALRVVVNKEAENLKSGLAGAIDLLAGGGKLLVITFNSTEDRRVKFFFKSEAEKKEIELLDPIFPSREEIRNNRLARSAKLRVLIKKYLE